jgi:hypothetical protein
MNRSIALDAGVLHSNKPLIPHLIDRPRKSLKHRYERRKIREVLRLSDWTEEA